MRALMVRPGVPNSAELGEVPEPKSGAHILVRTKAIGICGTDLEILAGKYGTPPPGSERLIIGHESLGEVVEAAPDSGFAPGNLVVGIVRRPDPVPCPCCAVGEWDMCKNGQYTERGIRQRHGFGSEYFTIRPEFAVKVEAKLGRNGVLIEPASVIAKAWEHIQWIGQRTRSWEPRRVLVMGAGTVGLLAALVGVQRGFEVHVLDRVNVGLKPDLVRNLGATYYVDPHAVLGVVPDIVLECTGATPLIFDAVNCTAPGGWFV